MLTKNANLKIWCDYCKAQYGQQKDKTWYLQAQTPAVWTITSNDPRFAKITRHYCNRHALEVTHWACECGDPIHCINRWNLNEQTKELIQTRIDDEL